MMQLAQTIARQVARRVLGVPWWHRAHRVIELSPRVVRRAPPAVYLQASVDRIQRVCDLRVPENEWQMMKGGPVEHVATTLEVLKDVEVIGPHVYREGRRHQIGYLDPACTLSRRPPPERDHLHHASLVTSFAGANYFGTFMHDDLPLELLPNPAVLRLGLPTKAYDHEPAYRRALDLEPPRRLVRVHVDELEVFADFSQNDSKRARYDELRSRMARSMAVRSRTSSRGVYIRRGRTGQLRLLQNETDIEARLSREGFEIVDPATESADTIMTKTAGAPVIVSVEGSQLSHAIYTMADRGSMVVLQPPDRFSLSYKDFTDCVDMHFGFVVGTLAQQGFQIDIDEVLTIVDRCEALA